MRSLISASLLAGFLSALPYAAQAGDDKPADCKPGQILAESMDLSSCYGNGDKAPDQYTREEVAIKDWKAKGLPQPGEHEQWVQISGHYVLVNRVNAVIKEIRTKNAKVLGK
ncbi:MULTISPECIES: RcnB family protein [unclassified Pseudomonas]|uniref:RcnB family protein n=1 Tax=unclassified Pseudomonas TaxID=196821 RepID=UPI0010559E20|nr:MULTISPECIES: RcnB family protein [unclassified Pseudomonas]MEC4167922.1 RcnB family protein [Pseudomonas sp. MS-1(2024)]